MSLDDHGVAAHAERWIEIGLRTGDADRERFESSVAECYEHAGLDWPGVVVWVNSPLALELVAIAAASCIAHREHRWPRLARKPPAAAVWRESVGDDLRTAVREQVGLALRSAVGYPDDDPGWWHFNPTRAVADAYSRVTGEVERVESVVREAVGLAFRGGATNAEAEAVAPGVEAAVGELLARVRGAELSATDRRSIGGLLEGVCTGGNRTVSASTALDEGCSDGRTAGGQLAVGGGWTRVNGLHDWLGSFGEPVSTSWFRDVVGVELPDDLWARARAYESIAQSASWWTPYRRFVLAAERPAVIRPGPAAVWPDGWGARCANALQPCLGQGVRPARAGRRNHTR